MNGSLDFVRGCLIGMLLGVVVLRAALIDQVDGADPDALAELTAGWFAIAVYSMAMVLVAVGSTYTGPWMVVTHAVVYPIGVATLHGMGVYAERKQMIVGVLQLAAAAHAAMIVWVAR